MTHEQFEEYMAGVKARRIALEKIIIALNPSMAKVIEDMKACVDRAAEKYKVNKEKLS